MCVCVCMCERKRERVCVCVHVRTYINKHTQTQWSGRPGFNLRFPHTNEFKNGTYHSNIR